MLEAGGSQERVMNLVEVMTAWRLEGAEGTEWSSKFDPRRDKGRLVVIPCWGSAEHKIKNIKHANRNKKYKI